MHMICGRLERVELSTFGDMASLTMTIQQHGSDRYTGQTIKCLASLGSGPDAELAAQRAMAQMPVGGNYQIKGAALAATEAQMWLMGVAEWRLTSPPRTLVLAHAEALA